MNVASWVGPCEHGRDPWDRCDVCGELDEREALLNAFHAQSRALDEAVAAMRSWRRQFEAQAEAHRAAFDMLRGELAEQRRVAAEEFNAAREAEKQLSETRAECCAEFNRARTLAEELRAAKYEIHLLESEAGNARSERDEWRRVAEEGFARTDAIAKQRDEARRELDVLRVALADMRKQRDEFWRLVEMGRP